MKKILVLAFIIKLTSVSIFAQISDSIRRKHTEVEFHLSNGFYNIKQIDSGRYESSGLQLSFGISASTLISKRLRSSVSFFYTGDKFNLKDVSIDTANKIKRMSYFDFSFPFSYEYLRKEKFRFYLIGGFSFGLLGKGGNESVGIYWKSNFNFPGGTFKQFNEITLSGVIGNGFTIHLSEHISLDSKLIWRQYFNQIDLTEKKKHSTINLLVSLIYGWKTMR
jgi:hypothetical protein